MMSYNLSDNWDKDYALALFETIYLPKYSQTGALPSFNDSIIKRIPVYVPTVEEQRQVGKYFKNLDQNIETKKAELNKLKQFKQAMLDKMFV